MENTNPRKQIVFKNILITSMAACAAIYVGGSFVTVVGDYLKTFNNFGLEIFIFNTLSSFFLFLFVSISLWILFSQLLPKNWIFASLVGALLAGLLPSIRSMLIIEEYPLMSLYLRFLDASVLVGFIGTLPQWWLLKRNSVAKSYYWLIVNCIGWGIIGLFWNQYLTLSYVLMGKMWTVFFNWFQPDRLWQVLEICSFIPLGLGMGLFFTRISMNKKRGKSDANEIEPTSHAA